MQLWVVIEFYLAWEFPVQNMQFSSLSQSYLQPRVTMPKPNAHYCQKLPTFELLTALEAQHFSEISSETLLALGGASVANLLVSPQSQYWIRAWAARAFYYHWSDLWHSSRC